MLLFTLYTPMLLRQQQERGFYMNLENRRLREIQKEKQFFRTMLDNSESISDCLTYQGKLELLDKEEAEILERNDVII